MVVKIKHEIRMREEDAHAIHYNWVEEHTIIIEKDGLKNDLELLIFCTRPFGTEFWNQNPFILSLHFFPDFSLQREQRFYTELSNKIFSRPQERREHKLLIGFTTLSEVLTFMEEHLEHIKGLATKRC